MPVQPQQSRPKDSFFYLRRLYSNKVFATGVVCLFLALTAHGAVLPEQETQSAPNPVTADDLLEAVLARFPHDPISISGAIETRRRHGMVQSEFRYEIRLDMSAYPHEGSYLIMDAFGTPLERLDIKRTGLGRSKVSYFHGSDLEPAPPPNMFSAVQDTNLSWLNLTLGFLWWKNAEITGKDEVLGRPCYVVEMPAPRGKSGECARVVLWIEEKLLVVLRTEEQDGSHKPLRRLWIKSLKKMNDRWMIKDMEAQSFPSSYRTRIRVLEIETRL